MDIRIASSAPDVQACYPVFRELRPHLTEAAFLAQVQRQVRDHGYAIASVQDGGQVVAAAGYRVAEFLAWGRTFYVDDFVTASAARRRGYGGQLLDWLPARAREADCDQFHLDSGVQRFDAHRLYMSRRLLIGSHHFSLSLR